jgi:transcriptional regulator with XRE-family HTH domain
MNFGERLRQIRKEKGLTQAEVAKLLSIGESTVSFYESGKRQPDYETLVRLSEAFKVSTDFLLGKTDIKNPIETIAAHHDGEDWTEEELEDIEKFKEFVRMRRQQRRNKE